MSMFSSRPPFNDDPEPWVHGDIRAPKPRYEHIMRWIHDPRPEFDCPQHNPTNPILVWFRAVLEDPKCGTFDQVLDDFLIFHIKGHGRHEHHARKVLVRLATLTKDDAA